MNCIPISSKQLLSIILSHGWFALKPFQVDLKKPSIAISYDLPGGCGKIEIIGNGDTCEYITHAESKNNAYEILYTCLSLNEDTNLIYQDINDEIWQWFIHQKMGRFLRSASLYEDCCKAILSTNTTWKRTVSMVDSLVENYGQTVINNKAFPRPEIILKASEKELRENILCGFRARYLQHLAEVSLKKSDFFLGDNWKQTTNKEFYDTLNDVTGLGPTTINYLSLLYWKFNGFVIDAYVRRRCKELWHVTDELDEFLKTRYNSFGTKAPMVLWFEITKHWHDNPLTV